MVGGKPLRLASGSTKCPPHRRPVVVCCKSARLPELHTRQVRRCRANWRSTEATSTSKPAASRTSLCVLTCMQQSQYRKGPGELRRVRAETWGCMCWRFKQPVATPTAAAAATVKVAEHRPSTSAPLGAVHRRWLLELGTPAGGQLRPPLVGLLLASCWPLVGWVRMSEARSL